MPERFALYYPYIHFRDMNWLKSAVLTFGQVRRMVPDGYTPRDDELVHALKAVLGDHGGPLVDEESVETESVREAQHRLERCIQEDHTAAHRFSRTETERQSLTPFELCRSKVSGSLTQFLEGLRIAWPATEEDQRSAHGHLCLHPRLGEAIMAVTAITIAREKGLSIVTPEPRVHSALMSQDEEAIFRCLSCAEPTDAAGNVDSDNLLQGMLVHTFDLSVLNAADIADLAREQEGLRSLRMAIEEEVLQIPPIPDQSESKRRAELAARRILDRWKSSKRNAVWEGVKTVVDLREFDLPAAVSTAISGGTTYATVNLGAGLAVAFAVYAGARAVRGYQETVQSPYRYLTLVDERIKLNALSTSAANRVAMRMA